MAKSTAAGIETTPVRLTLQVLHRDPDPREVVSRLQHMFNDIDAAAGQDPIFEETGEYGSKTFNRVKKLQRESGLEGLGVWEAAPGRQC